MTDICSLCKMTWNRSNNDQREQITEMGQELMSQFPICIPTFCCFLVFLRGAGYILKINYNGSSLTSVTGLI